MLRPRRNRSETSRARLVASTLALVAAPLLAALMMTSGCGRVASDAEPPRVRISTPWLLTYERTADGSSAWKSAARRVHEGKTETVPLADNMLLRPTWSATGKVLHYGTIEAGAVGAAWVRRFDGEHWFEPARVPGPALAAVWSPVDERLLVGVSTASGEGRSFSVLTMHDDGSFTANAIDDLGAQMSASWLYSGHLVLSAGWGPTAKLAIVDVGPGTSPTEQWMTHPIVPSEGLTLSAFEYPPEGGGQPMPVFSPDARFGVVVVAEADGTRLLEGVSVTGDFPPRPLEECRSPGPESCIVGPWSADHSSVVVQRRADDGTMDTFLWNLETGVRKPLGDLTVINTSGGVNPLAIAQAMAPKRLVVVDLHDASAPVTYDLPTSADPTFTGRHEMSFDRRWLILRHRDGTSAERAVLFDTRTALPWQPREIRGPVRFDAGACWTVGGGTLILPDDSAPEGVERALRITLSTGESQMLEMRGENTAPWDEPFPHWNWIDRVAGDDQTVVVGNGTGLGVWRIGSPTTEVVRFEGLSPDIAFDWVPLERYR